MALDPQGLLLSIVIIIASGVLVVALTSRMRIALEMVTLFALSNIFLIVAINIIEPQSIQEYLIIAIFPALLLVYGGFRFNQLFKHPYRVIVESSKRVWDNDLTIIQDDIALQFTGPIRPRGVLLIGSSLLLRMRRLY